MTTDLARQADNERGLAVADREQAAGALAHILATGDLSKLTDEGRCAHYLDLCESLSLNPRSRPFDWLVLDNKLVLYPNKSCAEQLRRQHQISVKVTRRDIVGELFVCEVEGRTPSGRTDEASKYVPITATNRQGEKYRLSGTNLAHAFAKAETGAKRRLVLSMVGLASPPDPEEVKSVRFVVVDGSGRVLDSPTLEQKALADNPAMARVIGEPTYETTGDADRAPLTGTTGQQVRAEELQRPERPQGPRPTFRVSEEDIKRWLGAWFATVKETPWDTDDARHRFVLQWTSRDARWPETKVTASLRTMFARATEREVADFLAGIRAIVAYWRSEQEAEDGEYPNLSAQVRKDPDVVAEPPAGMTEQGHAAAVLTGAPPTPAREEDAEPDRLDPSHQYSRPELFELYDQWAARMSSLDKNWRPDAVKRLADAALTAKVRDLIAQTTDLEEYLAGLDDGEPDADDDQAEPDPAF